VAGSRSRQVRNWLLYRGLVAATAVGRRIPLVIGRKLGRLVGRVAARVLRGERKRAIASLEVAFPHLTHSDGDDLVDRMFDHLGMSLFEIAWLPNLDARAVAKTTTFEGLELLREAVDRGKGVVLFTGHCGNWEWMAAALSIAGFHISVIAREIYDDRINELMIRIRNGYGVSTIVRGSSSSAREMLRTLRGETILGVLIDQSIRAESVLVSFFGQPAPTPVGPAKLAARSGAAVLACFVERQSGRHHVHFEAPVPLDSADAAAITAAMTAATERQIRRVPEQWVWMHRRWRDLGQTKKSEG
jgi:KDO2-lipid IV(A) lauroyltransferase